jgi:hypothetical protein
MSTPVNDIERHALAAHRRGATWTTFWREYGAEVRDAEPWLLDAQTKRAQPAGVKGGTNQRPKRTARSRAPAGH